MSDTVSGGKVISTVNYSDGLMVLAMEETVLQCTIDKLIEIGRWYGMEMNMEKRKTKMMRISRQQSPLQSTIDHKQLHNVEYCNYVCSRITNDATCTREIKSRIAMAKHHSTRRRFFSARNLGLNLRKQLVKFYIWSVALYHAEIWTL
jgi:hypothetical protein